MDATVESRAQLLALVRGYRISQAIYVVTQLGIPDLLADGPREIDELARATGSHAPSLRRVLLFLAAVGVLAEVGPERFALTPMSALLRTGVPGSVRPSVLLSLGESHWRPWGHMLHTVRTGETAFDHAHGTTLFEYLAGHPEVGAVFNAGMLGNSPAHARLVAATYDFSTMSRGDRCRRRTRPAAGDDPRAVPRLHGVLFDQPHVIEEARRPSRRPVSPTAAS